MNSADKEMEDQPPSTEIIPNETPTALLDGDADADAEFAEEKPKYPKSVFFIISNEFCERFSYYGMRTILAIYLSNILHYSDDDATIIYHTFTMLCYFFPIFGAMLADSLLGKFRTIFYVSIIYAIGNIVISIASADEAIGVPARELSIVGLLLIAIGTGGIKPCVSAFGGDQFKLPQQEKQLQQFFSLFYFAINSGSLISTFLTPVLRQDVQCLGQESCYPLAFGVPAVLMILSLIIFLIGKPLYIIKNPEGNVVLRVCKCIGHAVVRRCKVKREEQHDHWLDYAGDKYDKTLINDIKLTLKVLFLYIPLPIFWALFDQQGSRWTFQATRMTGELGGWALKPDQMQVVNPLLILIFIPIFETCLYPLLAKCNLLKRPLQKLCVGGLLAAIAFVISAVVELQLEQTYAVVPKAGEAQLRIFNGFNCETRVYSDIEDNLINIKELDFYEKTLSVNGESSYKVTRIENDCIGDITLQHEVKLTENQASSFYITFDLNQQPTIQNIIMPEEPFDTIEKSKEGNPLVRVLYTFSNSNEHNLFLKEVDGSIENKIVLEANNFATATTEVDPTVYSLEVDGNKIGEEKIQLGGVYTLLLVEDTNNNNNIERKLLVITEPNSMHMLWLIPQYFVLTMGEVMFSITGLEFSFTQSPVSMKSLLQACWLITVAIGNLVVVIVAEAKIFDSQAYEFFLFAGLMVADMILFALMAMRYKYVEISNEENGEKQNDIALKGTTDYNEINGIDNTTFKGDKD